MPIYEYACDDCHVRETFSRLVDRRDDIVPCPKCGKAMRRTFGTFRFRSRPRGWKPYDIESSTGPESVDESFLDAEGRPIGDPRL